MLNTNIMTIDKAFGVNTFNIYWWDLLFHSSFSADIST